MTKRINWRNELSRWTNAKEDRFYVYAFTHLRCVYGPPLGEGRSRIVFKGRDGTNVIKLPKNLYGESANARELEPDNWLGAKERYAKTWKDLHLSRQTELLIIRMEIVREAHGRLPAWTGAVDCAQVGYNRAGKLVAYDWG